MSTYPPPDAQPYLDVAPMTRVYRDAMPLEPSLSQPGSRRPHRKDSLGSSCTSPHLISENYSADLMDLIGLKCKERKSESSTVRRLELDD